MCSTKKPQQGKNLFIKVLEANLDIDYMISDKVPFPKRVQPGRSTRPPAPYDAFPTAKFVIFNIKCMHKIYKNIYNIRPIDHFQLMTHASPIIVRFLLTPIQWLSFRPVQKPILVFAIIVF